MTLRRRLVLSIVALVVAVSAVIGAGSIIALASIQTGAIDQQLQTATKRATNKFGQGQTDQPPGDDVLRPAGQAAGTLTAYYFTNGRAGGIVIQDDGSPTSLSTDQLQRLGQVKVGVAPATIGLGSTGSYRVAAVRVDNGYLDDAVLVVGLPMSPVYQSVWSLLWVVIVVVGGALIAASIVAAVVVRRSLRPLERVAETASAVARMPLERSDALDGVRVPDTDPRTEVGRVGSAFNRMLGHIGGAMQARERSEQKVRQFVADASHELRTPLTSLITNLELLAEQPDDPSAPALAAAALAEARVPYRMLGAATPPRSLERAVREAKADAVVLWAQRPQTATSGALRALGRCPARRLVAGPGWDARPAAGAQRLMTLREAVAVLAGEDGQV